MAKEAEVSGWHSFDAINAPSFTNHIENATDLYISQHCQIETYFLWFRCTQKRENVEEINFFCSVIEWKSQFYFKVMLLCMFLKCAERKWENFCFKVKKNFVKSEKLCGFFMRERKKMGKFKVSTNWFNNFPSRLLMDNFQTLTTKDDQQIALNILNALREWKLAQVAQAFSSQHFFFAEYFFMTVDNQT